MKIKILLPLAASAISLFLPGCDTAPTVQYPVTYQVPIGNSQVTSAYGPQNLNVSGVRDVAVRPGMSLYDQAVSPVNLTFYAFAKTGPGRDGRLLGKVEGTMVNSSVVLTGESVEFVFSAVLANSGGAV